MTAFVVAVLLMLPSALLAETLDRITFRIEEVSSDGKTQFSAVLISEDVAVTALHAVKGRPYVLITDEESDLALIEANNPMKRKHAEILPLSDSVQPGEPCWISGATHGGPVKLWYTSVGNTNWVGPWIGPVRRTQQGESGGGLWVQRNGLWSLAGVNSTELTSANHVAIWSLVERLRGAPTQCRGGVCLPPPAPVYPSGRPLSALLGKGYPCPKCGQYHLSTPSQQVVIADPTPKPSPPSVGTQGPKGDPGPKGDAGPKGDPGRSPTAEEIAAAVIAFMAKESPKLDARVDNAITNRLSSIQIKMNCYDSNGKYIGTAVAPLSDPVLNLMIEKPKKDE